MATATEERTRTLNVVPASEFEASCDCDDFQWHQETEESREDFLNRKARSSQLIVSTIKAQYGTVVIKTRTKDSNGSRAHEVILSRGDGPAWVCKHILRALRTKALMPTHRRKEVCYSEEEATVFAERHDGSLVTSCNNAYIVGWSRMG